MVKRKAEAVAPAVAANGTKKAKRHEPANTASGKRDLLNDEASSGDDSEVGGVALDSGFKINEAYAKRFEHNKKREELQRLEEKFKKESKQLDDDDRGDDDSTSEEEDDDGFLATEALDAEISATLEAIRAKDPRVYDKDATFYAPLEEVEGDGAEADKKEKPLYLRDYHREKLLSGKVGDDDDDEHPKTFVEEQEELKKDIIGKMHNMVDSDDESDGDGFMVPKHKPQQTAEDMTGLHPDRATKIKPVKLDIANANKDPETFLSNFLSSRAWLPKDGSRWQAFESDDDDDDMRADEFENAYNMRFEDPDKSNEVLKTYARDVVAAKSVRREAQSGRKKQREAQREKEDDAKRERNEEKARLRKLKIEQMEEKLKKIKLAAGLRSKSVESQDWTQFLDDGWDDAAWEAEMNKRFGDDYYAENDAGNGSEDNDGETMKKKPKKPKWEDDIDIHDIVPDFEAEDDKPTFSLSEGESGDEADDTKRKSSKEIKEAKAAARREARKERRKIEAMVDAQLDLEVPLAGVGSSKQTTRFRYRETSPTSFGLTPRDILLAPDAALNQFAGLKKLAAFREADKKKKDKKMLSKKARLRQWRQETFGDEDGPRGGFKGDVAGADGDVADTETVNGVAFGEKAKKKRKRSKQPKSVGESA